MGMMVYSCQLAVDDLKRSATVDAEDHVLNRARLYRDRRDFVIQPGDTGRREDYPVGPAG